jgi:hypothetical protein
MKARAGLIVAMGAVLVLAPAGAAFRGNNGKIAFTKLQTKMTTSGS